MFGIKFKRNLKIILSISIIIIIFIFLGLRFKDSLESIKQYSFSYVYFTISIIVTLSSVLFTGIVYYFLLKYLGAKVTLKKSLKAHLFADAGSYVPGKVMNVLARLKFVDDGVRRSYILLSVVIETLLLCLAAVLYFLIEFKHFSIFERSYLILALLPIVLILLHPKVLGFIINLILKLFKKSPLSLDINLRRTITLFGLYMIYWFLNGLGLFMTIKAFYSDLSFNRLLFIVSINAISWVIGYISALTPAGLGVKESVITILSVGLIPEFAVIAASVLFRMVTILSIVVAIIIFGGLDKFKKLIRFGKI